MPILTGNPRKEIGEFICVLAGGRELRKGCDVWAPSHLKCVQDMFTDVGEVVQALAQWFGCWNISWGC